MDQEQQESSRRHVLVELDPASLKRAAIIAVVALAVYQAGSWLLGSLSSLLLQVLLGWLIAVAVDPVVAFLERKGWRRGAAAGLILGSLAVVSAAFVALLGRASVDQFNSATARLPDVVDSVVAWVNGSFSAEIDASVILDALSLDSAEVAMFAAGTASGVVGVVSNFFAGLLAFVVVTLFAFYFAADGPRVQRFLASFLRPDRQVVFLSVWDIAVAKAGAFLVSKSVLAALSAVAHAVFFYAVGLPHWLPLGVFAGIVSQFIPVIGTYVGVIVPALFALTSDAWDAAWIVVFATVYQQVENYVLTPRLAKTTMDIHPGVAIGSVLAGFALLGPAGTIVAIPVAAVLIAVAQAYAQRYALHPAVHAATAPGGSPASSTEPEPELR